VTFPKKVRDVLNVTHVMCLIKGEDIVLRPLKTREDFFAELEADEKDWEQHCGYRKGVYD